MFAIVMCLVLLMCTLTISSSVSCVFMVNVCCGECYVVSNACDEPTSCLVQPIGAHSDDVMYLGSFGIRVSLVS